MADPVFIEAIRGYLDPAAIKVAMDVGSRDAVSALMLANTFPNATVHAFECNPQTLPICYETATHNARLRIVPMAVNAFDGICVFHPIDPSRTRTTWADGNPGASSLFVATGDYPHETYTQQRIEAACTRLDTYCREARVPFVDVMWMDLQGAELLALQSMGDFLPDFLWTEVTHKPMYHGQCLYPELHTFLIERGYTQVVAPDMSGWQGDAAYIHERRARIDVVIPCAEKDVGVVNACIQGVRTNVPEVRRIFVVSKERLTSEAEWLPESAFPFSRADVERVAPHTGYRAGWYLAQLFKLYAVLTVPQGTHRVLVVDADTVFQRRCSMLGDDGVPLYAIATEHHTPYFEHMERLLPGLRRMQDASGIVHHMLFDRDVVTALFQEVEQRHGKPFWQAFLEQIDPSHAVPSATCACASGAADYEIYFNYWQWKKPQAGRIRPLAWENTSTLTPRPNLDFISAHSWLRA
jgi:FkbM family methyltransferase